MGQVWGTNTLGGYAYSDQLSKVLRTALQPMIRFRQFCDADDASSEGLHAGSAYNWNVYSDVGTQGGVLTVTVTRSIKVSFSPTLITAGWQYTEFIPRATFQIIDQAIRTPGGSAMIPLVGLEREEPGPPDRTFKPKGEQIAGDVTRRGGVPVEFMGAAVFKAGRMVGAVNGDEVGVVKFVKGEIEETFEHIPDPCKRDKLIVVRIFPRQRPEIEIDLRGTGPPRVMATVFLEGDIVSIQGRTEYDEPELISVLEREVVKNRNEEAREAVERAQELEADIFGFGWQAKKQFLAWRDWEDYRWGEQFSHADIEVTFDLKVRRVGLVHESPLFRPD
ncbi:MAG: hypothetical protein C4575_04435 [Desulforudis sp.]|nr:MAG: hypothetical protein C4575_04435 [Desulforudis sp.]